MSVNLKHLNHPVKTVSVKFILVEKILFWSFYFNSFVSKKSVNEQRRKKETTFQLKYPIQKNKKIREKPFHEFGSIVSNKRGGERSLGRGYNHLLLKISNIYSKLKIFFLLYPKLFVRAPLPTIFTPGHNVWSIAGAFNHEDISRTKFWFWLNLRLSFTKG